MSETERQDETAAVNPADLGKLQIVEAIGESEETDKEEEVNFRTGDSNGTDDSTGSNTRDSGGNERDEEKIDEEKLVDWAYSVMDWLKVAADARAVGEIQRHMEDIITAFIILVKEEHRGIVLDVLKKLRRLYT